MKGKIEVIELLVKQIGIEISEENKEELLKLGIEI